MLSLYARLVDCEAGHTLPDRVSGKADSFTFSTLISGGSGGPWSEQQDTYLHKLGIDNLDEENIIFDSCTFAYATDASIIHPCTYKKFNFKASQLPLRFSHHSRSSRTLSSMYKMLSRACLCNINQVY